MKQAKVSKFTSDPQNANRGTERGRQLLDQSLQDLGAGRSILVDKHDVTIAGNKTLEAAVKSGLEDAIVVETDGTCLVVVKRTDLDLSTDEKAKRLAIADNRIGQISLEWDAAVLAGLAEEVDLSGLFEAEELSALLAGINQSEPAEENEEEVADLVEQAETGEIESRVSAGQIWACGRHRVCCGDSTDLVVIEALLNNRHADCCWTDPPYGVSYVGKTKDALTIQNDGFDNLEVFLTKSFQAIDAALKPGAPIYMAHPAGALQIIFGNCFVAQGWRLHQTLTWVKNSLVLGHSDYHFIHEPIYFGYKPGKGRLGRGGVGWYGDNSQVSVFEVDRPSRSSEHPTMKPPELIERMLSNSCPPGGLVFEPFGGSGSTLVASHGLNMICYSIELDPQYCEVILRRYEALTGQLAELVGYVQAASFVRS